MPPGITLEITVTDKGTPVVRQFSGEVQKLGQQGSDGAGGLEKLTQATTRTSASLGTSAASALRFAGVLTGVQLGVAATGQALQAAVQSVVSFEASLANVNTLGIRSTDVQRQLREQLIALPPILGTATELSHGLYEALSSGVEPAKAVQFVRDAAILAQAGLASLDTTTAALTKTMAAYNIPTEKAGEVSDILFKVVEIGQGTLEQFAGALPQVTQISSSLGVSLTDTANAMATLSQTFRNADTAATGYRSLLQQLIQNSDKFLALGINIRHVISQQGLLGAVQTLREVSQGSSERLRAFINDVEGFNAALALTGPQFNTLVANHQKFQQASGSVAEAVKQQSVTTAAAWKEFTGSVDRGIQALGPAITGTLTTILRGANTLVQGINEQILLVPKAVEHAKTNLEKTAPAFAAIVRMLLAAPVVQGPRLTQSLDEQHAALLRTRDAFLTAGTAQANLVYLNGLATVELDRAFKAQESYKDAIVRQIDAQQRQQKTVAEVNTALQAHDAALKELKGTQALTTEQVLRYADTIETSLKKAAASGLVASTTLKKGLSDGLEAVFDRLGHTTTGLRDLERQLTKTSLAAPALGAITRVLKEVDEQGNVTLRTIQALSGSAQREFKAAESAIPPVTQAIKEVDASGKVTLRTIEVFGPATEEAFARRAVRAVKALDTALKQSVDELDVAVAKFGASSPEALAKSFTEGEIEVAFALGNISRRARDAAMALQQAGQDGGKGFADGVRDGAEQAAERLDDVAGRAHGLQDIFKQTGIVFKQAFGDTPRQLFAQLAEQQQRISNAFQIASAAGLTEPGSFEAYRQQILDSANDAIFLITERLRDLGYNADGSKIATDHLTQSTATLTQTTTQATQEVQQQSTALVSLSLAAGAASGQIASLVDRQRDLLLVGQGSTITDTPLASAPVRLGSEAPGGGAGSLPRPSVQGATFQQSDRLAALEREILLGAQSGSLSPSRLQALLRERQALQQQRASLFDGKATPSQTLVTVLPSLTTEQASPTSTPSRGNSGAGSAAVGGTLPGAAGFDTPPIPGPFSGSPFSGSPFSGGGGSTRGVTPGGVTVPVMVVGTLTRAQTQALASQLASALREEMRRGAL